MIPQPVSMLRSVTGFALVTAIVVGAVAVAVLGLPVVAGDATTQATSADNNSTDSVAEAASEIGPADDLYLAEDGSAVLGYEADSDHDEFDIGVDVDDGLAYVSFVDDIAELDDTDEHDHADESFAKSEKGEQLQQANVSAVLEPDGFTGEGALVVDRPDAIRDLSIDAAGERTDEQNQFEATATGTTESQNATNKDVTTDGHVTVTPDRFETSGTVTVDKTTTGDDGSIALSVAEAETGYTVDVDAELIVSEDAADRWATREQAEATLQDRHGDRADKLGGTGEVTLSEYHFDDGGNGEHRLELSATIAYSGIDDGVEAELTDTLAEDPDLSHDEAASIASNVTALEIGTLDVAKSETDGTVEVEWDVALANTTTVSDGLIELVDAIGNDPFEVPGDHDAFEVSGDHDAFEVSGDDDRFEMTDDSDRFSAIDDNGLFAMAGETDLFDATGDSTPFELATETARTKIDAQQAADLERSLQWTGSVEQVSDDTAQIEADVEHTTENWAAYVDELEASGIERPGDIYLELTADTDGDELAIDTSIDVETDELAAEVMERMAASIHDRQMNQTDAIDQFATTVTDSELEVARIDASTDGETIHIEGGVAFDEHSGLTNDAEDVPIGGIATDEDGNTYIFIEELSETDTESATGSDGDQFTVIDSETTVHPPGDWDDEVPAIDTAGMAEYLGVDAVDETETESESETADDVDQDSVPGFGIVLTAIAGLVAVALLRRRA